MKRALFDTVTVLPFASGNVVDRTGYESAVLAVTVEASQTATIKVETADSTAGPYGPRVRVPGGAPDIERQIVRFDVLFCVGKRLHTFCTPFAHLPESTAFLRKVCTACFPLHPQNILWLRNADFHTCTLNSRVCRKS